jgi:hypothetical protein
MRTKAFAAVLLVLVTLVAFSATRDTPVREVLLAKPSPAESALDRVLPEVHLERMPLEEAIRRLESVAKARILVDWSALDRALIDGKAPVELRARGVSLADALTRLLRQHSSELGFTPDGAAVLVTTPEVLWHRRYIRCYDISDLVAPDRIPVGERVASPAPGPAPTTCWQGALFAGSALPAHEETAAEIVGFIAERLAVDNPHEKGLGAGVIRSTAGRLIVVQNWQNHRRIERLLAVLRDPVRTSNARAAAGVGWDGRLQQVPTHSDAADRALRTVLPEVRIDNAPLEAAVQTLARLAKANIVIDGQSMAEAELDRKHLHDAGADVSRIRGRTLRLHDVTLRDALKAVLREYSDSVWEGGFLLEGDVIVVTSKRTASRLLTRAYDLRDWPHVGAAVARPLPSEDETEPPPDEFEELVKVITTTVEPDSWSGNGGVAEMRRVRDLLVVTQTWWNHEEVRRFLNALRADPPRPASTRPN